MRACQPTDPVVYVAGPLGTDPARHEENVRAACVAADQLIDHGFTPFVPHLNLYWDKLLPHTEPYWIAWDLAWLSRCDAVLRLSGYSRGADLEEFHARAAGIPVFDSVQDLVAWRSRRTQPGSE